jgi:predicted HicB family RNase H-like nuclease
MPASLLGRETAERDKAGSEAVNLWACKGHNAAVEFDVDDLILVGGVVGTNDVVGFHDRDAEEIVAAFQEAGDDHLSALFMSQKHGKTDPASQ